MIVHGLRVRLHNDPETCLPPARLKAGVIRFWRHVDNSRKGIPDTHQLVLTIPAAEVPCKREEEFMPTSFGMNQMTYDPARDVWTAPEQVEWLDLVTCADPAERLQPLRPRASDWKPDSLNT